MIEEIERINRLWEKAANRIFNFEPLIFQSEELINREEYEQARGLLNDILKIDDLQQDALNNMGVIEMLSKNNELAEYYFSKLLEINPENQIAKNNYTYLQSLEQQPQVEELNISDLNFSISELNKLVYDAESLKTFLGYIDDFSSTYRTGLEEYFGSKNDAALFIAKVSNILVLKYQYIRRHNYLLSKPFGLLLDPANGCNLHCPGCVHTVGDKYKFDWDKGILSEELFRKYLDYYGPYATHMLFYNYGEPFINKDTTRFISMAKGYHLYTSVSTNFSLPVDADAIVESGLDYLILSIDGATDESYKKYRKGGRFDVVVENIKKLVEAKRQHCSNTPTIVWQFLLFEHTINEVNLAARMADEFGIDELHLGVPFDVSAYDPEIRVAAEAPRISRRIPYPRNWALTKTEDEEEKTFPLDTDIEIKNWVNIYSESAIGNYPSEIKNSFTCDWLYKGIVIDANGRVLPCCSAPAENRNVVFSNLNKLNNVKDEVFNSEMFTLAREGFTDNKSYKEKIENLNKTAVPYCEECGGNNGSLNVNNEHLLVYLNNEELFYMITKENKIELTKWQ